MPRVGSYGVNATVTLVAEHDADAVLAQLAAKMSEDLVAILQLDLEIARWQDFDHAALEFYVFFSTIVAGQKLLARSAGVKS